MTKEQALQKIEALKQFVEELDKQHEFKTGQIWSSDGCAKTVYIVTDDLRMCRVQCGPSSYYPAGTMYDSGQISQLKYIGMAEDVLTIKS